MTHFVQNGKEKVKITFSKLVSTETRCMWRLCHASCLEILPYIPTMYIQYANRKILHCSIGKWNMKLMPFELLLVGTFRTQILNSFITNILRINQIGKECKNTHKLFFFKCWKLFLWNFLGTIMQKFKLIFWDNWWFRLNKQNIF